MGKCVAITGATGFVGGALARELAQQGHELRLLARANSDRSGLAGMAVDWQVGDVLQADTLPDLVRGVDWVIHAAGMLGQAGVPESAYHQLHVEGTRHLLTAVARHNPGARVLYVSSPGVLGPIDGPPADETALLAPSNPYERSKAAAEQVALDFAANGLDVVIARPEFIYGPGDLHVLGLFQAVQRGMFFTIDGGRAVCHPTFIADAVAGMIGCLLNGRSAHVYHITGPRPVSFRELGDTIAAALGVRSPWLSLPKPLALLAAATLEVMGKVTGITPPLSRTGVAFFSENRRFSWQKAHDQLGYTPQFDLAQGVAETVGWYQKQELL
ncbi:MAG: NAD-dependent epimerase/dehydratase family protein [Ardenticatenaceae bacterium]|nr:NAD-dependent epimerase/dehydratase family protein [Anaerolineales bacterium]MCB8921863.1 NAD-dependent epimerase/dehydratase family protein [Ardenticatenaceae bacterium]MCB8990979.1 NAD-dependent epimerase/dehydratase family protein [Ardenticatenaceae bacterium]MCB9005341.1 NAD-dependent epimerase/dehydratase family protein [Ardenticatenaceae bacterium]